MAIVKLTQKEVVKDTWYLEVPDGMPPEEILTYFYEQEIQLDTLHDSEVTEADATVSFSAGDGPRPHVVPLCPDYSGWPPATPPEIGQLIFDRETGELTRVVAHDPARFPHAFGIATDDGIRYVEAARLAWMAAPAK